MNNISAFIICMNEEAYLGPCLESLEGFDEIVIVDSGSTDGTLALIDHFKTRGFPIRLFEEPWRGFAGQKQFALEQCTMPWCFNIDSDERVDADLNALLPELMACPEEIVGWKVARRPFLIGYGFTPKHVHERRNLRLIRRGKGRYDLGQTVHEGIVPDGEVRPALKGSLLHFRPLPIEEQVLKENRYSTLKADQLVAKGQGARKFRLLANPPLYFARLFFRNGLWRCGFPGFIEAMTGAVYSFLTEAKIYQRNAMKGRLPSEDGDRP